MDLCRWRINVDHKFLLKITKLLVATGVKTDYVDNDC
jgi:hypothetical protein